MECPWRYLAFEEGSFPLDGSHHICNMGESNWKELGERLQTGSCFPLVCLPVWIWGKCPFCVPINGTLIQKRDPMCPQMNHGITLVTLIWISTKALLRTGPINPHHPTCLLHSLLTKSTLWTRRKAAILSVKSNQGLLYSTETLPSGTECTPATTVLLHPSLGSPPRWAAGGAWTPSLWVQNKMGRAGENRWWIKALRVTCTGRDLGEHLVQCPHLTDTESERGSKDLPKVIHKLEARAGLSHMCWPHPAPGLSSIPSNKARGSLVLPVRGTPFLKNRISFYPSYLIAQHFHGKIKRERERDSGRRTVPFDPGCPREGPGPCQGGAPPAGERAGCVLCFSARLFLSE